MAAARSARAVLGALAALAACVEVDSGRVVAAVGVGRDVEAPLLPLSVVKLHLAALWWDRGMGEGSFPHPRLGRVTVRDMLEQGHDQPGRDMAARLRRAMGTAPMLAALRAIGAGGAGLVEAETARRLQSAMLGAVERGTARSAAPILQGSGWKLGGKTGTGPDRVGPTSDGWFAGLVFEGDRPRHAVAVFVEGRGPGGGVAAGLAAALARPLADGGAR